MKTATESALADALEKTAWSLMQLSNCIEDKRTREEIVKKEIGPAVKSLFDVVKLLRGEARRRRRAMNEDEATKT